MVSREELVVFLDDYLNINSIDDYSYNGLQFTGNNKIKRVVFAVDAGVEVFNKAALLKGDFLVVHHGLFWKKGDPRIKGVMYNRLKILWENNISLYGVHLPLDMHKIVGNNAELIRISGAKQIGSFDSGIGALGSFDTPILGSKIEDRLTKELNVPDSFNLFGIDKLISKVAIMSGACSRDTLSEAASLGADMLITGERSEFYHDAQDFGISVLFLGHNGSEQVGVKALSKVVKIEFPELDTIFLDVPTGL